MSSKKSVTIVNPIDWKESFSSHPFIIVNAVDPIRYRIVCHKLSDDGAKLAVLPSLFKTIDDFLMVMEGCLDDESNFSKVLEEYYGKEIRNLSMIEYDFNGIVEIFEKGMTAKQAKLMWIKDALEKGYAGVAAHLTDQEIEDLKKEDPYIETLISLYLRYLKL